MLIDLEQDWVRQQGVQYENSQKGLSGFQRKWHEVKLTAYRVPLQGPVQKCLEALSYCPMIFPNAGELPYSRYPRYWLMNSHQCRTCTRT